MKLAKAGVLFKMAIKNKLWKLNSCVCLLSTVFVFWTKILSVGMHFIVCQWHKWRFKVNLSSILTVFIWTLHWMRCRSSDYHPCQAAVGTYSLVWSPRVRRCLFVSSPWSRRAQGLVSTQKTASIWWCCCGCSLKFICREWSKEKAFRQIALWISALHLLLFLACGTHVVCHEWNAAERRVKGEKIWKRQEDPDMNLTHPQNAYINWSFAVWGKS